MAFLRFVHAWISFKSISATYSHTLCPLCPGKPTLFGHLNLIQMLNPDHHLASLKDQISWPIEKVLYFLIVGQVLPTFTMFCITNKSQSTKTKKKQMQNHLDDPKNCQEAYSNVRKTESMKQLK